MQLKIDLIVFYGGFMKEVKNPQFLLVTFKIFYAANGPIYSPTSTKTKTIHYHRNSFLRKQKTGIFS